MAAPANGVDAREGAPRMGAHAGACGTPLTPAEKKRGYAATRLLVILWQQPRVFFQGLTPPFRHDPQGVGRFNKHLPKPKT